MGQSLPQHPARTRDWGAGSSPVVGTVMRRGYKVGDVVVRHAMVGVVDTVENADVDSEQPAESED